MFSHIVVFWTDPKQADAADKLLAGANELLPSIPGVVSFHAGKMVPSERPVVEQSYQVALNIVLESAEAEKAYQSHPNHKAFVEDYFKPLCIKLQVFDFA
ncbi:MAG: Dabb family protein [Opitutales bacterium]|nr:Dabb family protein [Opitutales bacterium]MCH8541303.1 Dabb family protein [Opitutales bacterium]